MRISSTYTNIRAIRLIYHCNVRVCNEHDVKLGKLMSPYTYMCIGEEKFSFAKPSIPCVGTYF